MAKQMHFQQPPSPGPQKRFSQIPAAEIPRSKFDRSHGVKFDFNHGRIIPFLIDEVYPGDTYDVESTHFIRLATPLRPFMDQISVDIHYFFVPNRIVWNNWEAFLGNDAGPSFEDIEYTVPQTTVDLSAQTAEEMKRFIFPVAPANPDPITMDVSVLPFRGYVEIYNEWYRDQNVQDIKFNEYDDDVSLVTGAQGIFRRGKRKDYFTSCLPWPQAGEPVYIPVGTRADVVVDPNGTGVPWFKDSAGTTSPLVFGADSGSGDNYKHTGGAIIDDENAQWDTTALIADLTTAAAVSINDLRTAFQIQRLLERDARSGRRYQEQILAHFGVIAHDHRLGRPEYLGGGSGNITINPIASTVHLDPVPQGELAAVGTGLAVGGFKKSFVEHGIVFGLISTRANLTYQDGIEKTWFRQTKYDYYWPALAHLGEMAVENREIYITGDDTDTEVFGYQERWAELRYKPSRVFNNFRSKETTPLDVWHLAQDFDSLPVLSDVFIREDAPIERVIAVPSESHYLMDAWVKMHCDRPMPTYSVPGLIDHF